MRGKIDGQAGRQVNSKVCVRAGGCRQTALAQAAAPGSTQTVPNNKQQGLWTIRVRADWKASSKVEQASGQASKQPARAAASEPGHRHPPPQNLHPHPPAAAEKLNVSSRHYACVGRAGAAMNVNSRRSHGTLMGKAGTGSSQIHTCASPSPEPPRCISAPASSSAEAFGFCRVQKKVLTVLAQHAAGGPTMAGLAAGRLAAGRRQVG